MRIENFQIHMKVEHFYSYKMIVRKYAFYNKRKDYFI